VGDLSRARTGRRPVRFDDWLQTPVYDRAALALADRIDGPAVIEEFGSTVPVHPGFTVTVDAFGNLNLTRQQVPADTYR
jgi:N-methylhydantoinase A